MSMLIDLGWAVAWIVLGYAFWSALREGIRSMFETSGTGTGSSHSAGPARAQARARFPGAAAPHSRTVPRRPGITRSGPPPCGEAEGWPGTSSRGVSWSG